jgi:hypothetical protein
MDNLLKVHTWRISRNTGMAAAFQAMLPKSNQGFRVLGQGNVCIRWAQLAIVLQLLVNRLAGSASVADDIIT